MSRTDKHWVERCLDGHPEDYRHLVERYQGAVLAYVRGRLDEAADPEDAAQEAFVRAFFALPKLRERDSFFGWILGIARRVAEEVRRGRRRRLEAIAKAAWARELANGDSCGRGSRRDWDAALECAIGRLPETYREVVLLRYYGGLTCAQVAQRLELPLGTVTKNLSRAYALMRKFPELAAIGREDREDSEDPEDPRGNHTERAP
jgi:RNA polymerase sigma-70 factor (ECF subfamily)